RRVDAGVVGGGGRDREHTHQHAGGGASGHHRRARSAAVRPASRSSPRIVVPPNGIQTNHSAMALLLSTPYAGMSALQIKRSEERRVGKERRLRVATTSSDRDRIT